MELNTTEEIIQDIRDGKMVVLMDDEDRENEGDIVMAAERVTAGHINFMARHARGLICMPMSQARSERLGLRAMVEGNGSGFGTNFTTSIEAATGVTTGISAADRARTVQVAAARGAGVCDIVQPGHIFPLVARPGGVMVRAGHTEAACDLARLAGFEETGVICEIMNDDGTMARRPDLELFAREHGLKIGTIADLIHYRVLYESTIEKLGEAPVATADGQFMLHTYRDTITGKVHLAMVRGQIDPEQAVLARVQLAVTVRDMFAIQAAGSSGWDIRRCLARVAAEGAGVVVLLSEQETADDLLDSIDTVRCGSDFPRRPQRGRQTFLNVGVGSQILRALGLRKLRLMSAPVKYHAISGFDLKVVEYVKPD
ncbi:bifunctional 3,4-dihydroxy-2-butanone-4-phosphate synthase/GTP cyclohydrolase II [Pseudoduganella namucuonensis]|uniref:3,4-dihydroxy-2-butanone 4-phosphate synthase n=1 Tax=Pseudoduganella namucuonensis TaxID=1035707 RepID=A0A1I7KYL5_9BURK|nr:bifunctional 3,4-dihydroxy-2-butanone-4-phosphate synthase/GTP cyclohydrolase II [Pseudoduganella namucuonensis]SFV02602.1 GTP cyclohydrolase II /3,4-dihydroxy-2-butanone 4-phosphate synthase [Pseudoduganella namucuonensis]